MVTKASAAPAKTAHRDRLEAAAANVASWVLSPSSAKKTSAKVERKTCQSICIWTQFSAIYHGVFSLNKEALRTCGLGRPARKVRPLFKLFMDTSDGQKSNGSMS